eukprot:5431583-Ditylum_brightwellii.AAC.1
MTSFRDSGMGKTLKRIGRSQDRSAVDFLRDFKDGRQRASILLNNASPSHLPKFIIVDFGSEYTGATFFPDDETRRDWVPAVHPITASWYTPNRTPGQYDEHTRPMFPLRFA